MPVVGAVFPQIHPIVFSALSRIAVAVSTVGTSLVGSASVVATIVEDIMFLLEKSSDFAAELDDFFGVTQIFAALVVETKAGSVLEGVGDDSSCHLPNQESTNFLAEKIEISINLK